MEEDHKHGGVKKSPGRGSRINICFSILCLFIGFSPFHMLARISRRMFFLYNVPCPGAILCYALKQAATANAGFFKENILSSGCSRSSVHYTSGTLS